MNQEIKDWLLGFRCGPCCERGVERQAGVLLVVQDPDEDPEVVPFCYSCAAEIVPRYTSLLN